MYHIQALTKTYGTGKIQVKALDCVSFNVSNGEMLLVIGRSGSGKSTLLRLVGLLDRPTEGAIIIDNRDITKLPEQTRAELRLKHFGYVFQDQALLPELTAHQNVYIPGMMLSQPGVNYKERAKELLDLVGLKQRIHHRPKELSGGEQQRVAIARAMINNPRAILADEPCANLDTVSSGLVMETLVRLNHELRVTLIFISHDLQDKKYAQRIVELCDGRIVDAGDRTNS